MTSLTKAATVFSDVGDLVNDIPPEIVIPPTHTTAVQGDDAAVKLECVANARFVNRK